jgi:protein gp37
VRFVSAEPLLAPIDFRPRPSSDFCIRCGEGADAPHDHPDGYRTRGLDWIIVGGESGPRARPFDLAWARDIVAQCRTAGVAAFVKQLGARPTEGTHRVPWGRGYPSPQAAMTYRDEPKPLTLKHSHGSDMSEWPDDLRIREFPALV